MSIKQFVKDWTLPVAIAVGTIVYLTFYFVPQLDAAGETLGAVVDTIFPMMVFCTLFSAATAAPVVTAKIGGNINTMTAFVVLSSFASALMIPAVFPLLERGSHLTFWSAFLIILQKLAMVLIAPLALGWYMQHFAKRVCAWIVSIPDLSFYLWSVQLSVTSGVTVRNIVHSDAGLPVLLMIACVAHDCHNESYPLFRSLPGGTQYRPSLGG